MIQVLIFIRICKQTELISNKRKTISTNIDIEVIIIHSNFIFSIELVKNHEVSSQVDFCRSGQFNETRKDQHTIVPLYPEWKSKKASPERHKSTHEDMFVPLNARQNPLRASKLKLEEKRDRPFNIINGLPDSIV